MKTGEGMENAQRSLPTGAGYAGVGVPTSSCYAGTCDGLPNQRGENRGVATYRVTPGDLCGAGVATSLGRKTTV
jgi:hypothetical protein